MTRSRQTADLASLPYKPARGVRLSLWVWPDQALIALSAEPRRLLFGASHEEKSEVHPLPCVRLCIVHTYVPPLNVDGSLQATRVEGRWQKKVMESHRFRKNRKKNVKNSPLLRLGTKRVQVDRRHGVAEKLAPRHVAGVCVTHVISNNKKRLKITRRRQKETLSSNNGPSADCVRTQLLSKHFSCQDVFSTCLQPTRTANGTVVGTRMYGMQSRWAKRGRKSNGIYVCMYHVHRVAAAAECST